MRRLILAQVINEDEWREYAAYRHSIRYDIVGELKRRNCVRIRICLKFHGHIMIEFE